MIHTSHRPCSQSLSMEKLQGLIKRPPLLVSTNECRDYWNGDVWPVLQACNAVSLGFPPKAQSGRWNLEKSTRQMAASLPKHTSTPCMKDLSICRFPVWSLCLLSKKLSKACLWRNIYDAPIMPMSNQEIWPRVLLKWLSCDLLASLLWAYLLEIMQLPQNFHCFIIPGL